MALLLLQGLASARDALSEEVCAFSAVDALDSDDMFTVEDDDDWDNGIAVHSTLEPKRPCSPVVRALLWFCGGSTPTDDDRPSRRHKVRVD
jgi:hypothetical protein